VTESSKRFEAEPMDYAIVVPPTISPEELEPIKGVMIPCPGDEADKCDSADLLTEADAGWVEEYLGAISDLKRSASQEINFGCALAWLDDWASAKKAFVRARNKAKQGSVQKTASANAETADKALA
jgi:hypothetical protein